jgi:hypothetical protein
MHGSAPERWRRREKETLALLRGEAARRCSFSAIDQRLSVRKRLPQPRRFIIGGGQDEAAVGREHGADKDSTARVWDADSGREIALLKGHSGGVWNAAFSPDGKRVVTASDDSTAPIWDAESDKEIALLKGHSSGVLSAAFSAAARPLLERAVAIQEKVLDYENPHTTGYLHTLAIVLMELGDLTAARPILERALAIRQKVLGPEHPDTVTSRENLVALLRMMATS